ncbi:phosphoribosyltransferase family protein [Isoptericola sp. NEAU-Y5]|uniref:Phosphoribosyltransferase family protein n=1 Tax=Isoptericola luteus TaxID=2879484 RepID=A0ABS7Z9T6_9MICO|nr:phosphoribosyltransferase family protein [Isoptericola sp. NEAU-Y5]MCA5891821.1 phosphoribosyltransferase family protein [Isoptericola sp. NEAU-Y5]
MKRHAVSRLDRHASGALRMVGRYGDLDPAEYSRFKHGDGAASERYGELLATHAVRHLPLQGLSRLVVTSSGFDVAPPASHSLTAPFVDALQARLGSAVQIDSVKVQRTRPSNGDYATMDTAARMLAIGGTLDAGSAADALAGATVVALDDIVVTGLHEHTMDEALCRAGASVIHHLYVVDAHTFRHVPDVESELNRYDVHTVDDLLTLVGGTTFVPNARVARMLLGLPAAELDVAVRALPSWVVTWLLEVALCDPLADLPRYSAGADVVRELVGQAA